MCEALPLVAVTSTVGGALSGSGDLLRAMRAANAASSAWRFFWRLVTVQAARPESSARPPSTPPTTPPMTAAFSLNFEPPPASPSDGLNVWGAGEGTGRRFGRG